MSKYSQLRKEIEQCTLCKSIFGYDPHPILWGEPKAKIFQLGQAPSKTVHLTGKPFDDISGKRLRTWYGIDDDIFYNPSNFYITGVAHCFPGKREKGGDNPPPKVCAEQWVKREIKLVEAELYIAIGSYASKLLFPKQKLTDLVFQDVEYQGKPAFVIPHPSPLNMRWLARYPQFLETRMPFIQEQIHQVLAL